MECQHNWLSRAPTSSQWMQCYKLSGEKGADRLIRFAYACEDMIVDKHMICLLLVYSMLLPAPVAAETHEWSLVREAVV